MDCCKPVSVPLAEKLALSNEFSPLTGSDEKKQMKQLDYRGLVGGICYPAQTTRVDFALAILFRDSLTLLVRPVGKQQSMCFVTSKGLKMWDSGTP